MRRMLLIGCTCLLVPASIEMMRADHRHSSYRQASEGYVEDVYFWEDVSQTADGELVPNYNTRAREIIFIEDSSAAQHPDTVRAIIRDVQR